jgi:hypothetical protein
MNPWLLASIGIPAALGGIQGYRASGGDLGATLQGTLGGAAAGGLGYGAQRMAGDALKGLLTGGMASKVAPEAYKASQALGGLKAGGFAGATQAAKQAGLAAPMAQQMGGLNVLGKAAPVIAGAGGLAAGALAMPVLSGAVNLAGQAIGGPAQAAAQLGAGYLGSRGPGEIDYYQIGGDAVPVKDQFGNIHPYGTSPLDVIGPVGMARTAESLREITAQRDAARILLPEVQAASEAAKKKEMERMMAAAGIRQNIETAANMIQRSQQSMQQMGQTAAQGMVNALTSQYQYA